MGLDKDLKILLNKLQEIAKKRTANNRSFTEFTGLIGELAVCDYFDYTWNPDQGYDAIDKQSKKRIQIKARRLQTSTNLKGGTLGRFGSARTTDDEKDCYDFALGHLVVLDYNFNIAEIWTRDRKAIKDLEGTAKKRKKQSGKDKKLSGLNLSTFINNKNGNVKQERHGCYLKAEESIMSTYP